jgi:adenine phosphoribosyltransferase
MKGPGIDTVSPGTVLRPLVAGTKNMPGTQAKSVSPIGASAPTPATVITEKKKSGGSPSIRRQQTLMETNVALIYAFGVANFGLFAVLFGGVHFFESSRALETIVHVYSVEYLVLFGVRAWMYYNVHWHHFLLDWCYMTSFLLVVYLEVWNDNSALGVMVFSMVTGPLTMGNIIFQCKLVLHDMDKIISVFVHLIPSWLLYSIRWIHNDPLKKWQYTMCKREGWCKGNRSSADLAFWMILVPMGISAVQTLAMRIWINGSCNDKLRRRKGYINSVLFMEEYNCKTFFHRIGYRQMPLWQRLSVDVCISVFLSVLPFCSISFVLFQVQELHLAYLWLTTILCLFYGGNKLQSLANAAFRAASLSKSGANNIKVVPACAADGAASVMNKRHSGKMVPLASEIAAVALYCPDHHNGKYYDIGGLLGEPAIFQRVVDEFAARYGGMSIDKIGSFNARGFVFGASLALALKKPFFMLQKAEKLPNSVSSLKYSVEYGDSKRLEISRASIKKGDTVLLVDDVVATGSTLSAGIELVRHMGGTVVECGCVVELKTFISPPLGSDLPSRTKLFADKGIKDVPIWAVVAEDALQLKGGMVSGDKNNKVAAGADITAATAVQ